tara:strand:+ start:1076 stop:2056 length:981 start_codon:yes stop_codon:yes gene_type:complete
MKIKVGIIGFGLIGKKRLNALRKISNVIAVSDVNESMLQSKELNKLIKKKSWKDLVDIPDLDLVVICTLHDSLSEICIYAANRGKHILVEKPAGRNVIELKAIKKAIDKNKTFIHVGFNHRYHPAFLKANDIINSGKIGDLMFIRARYGHGGRLGYESEWRANKLKSGGGELIDQGVHLIDLAQMYLGEFKEIEGYLNTYFWDMSVEDNAFMTLRNSNNNVAFLHASCTEWKNTFSFEIFGQNGKILIDGLGGSYGIEKITLYKMLPEMGPPLTESWEFPFPDMSWEAECKLVIKNIKANIKSESDIDNAISVMKVVEKLYKENKL